MCFLLISRVVPLKRQSHKIRQWFRLTLSPRCCLTVLRVVPWAWRWLMAFRCVTRGQTQIQLGVIGLGKILFTLLVPVTVLMRLPFRVVTKMRPLVRSFPVHVWSLSWRTLITLLLFRLNLMANPVLLKMKPLTVVRVLIPLTRLLRLPVVCLVPLVTPTVLLMV